MKILSVSLMFLIISCAPHNAPNKGNIAIDKGSTGYTKGIFQNIVYEIQHIKERDYAAYGECMGIFSMSQKNVRELLYKKSNKLCKKEFGTQIASKKFSRKVVNNACDVHELKFSCDYTLEEKQKLKKINRKIKK